jgi:hypothetical protein
MISGSSAPSYSLIIFRYAIVKATLDNGTIIKELRMFTKKEITGH